MFKRQFAVILIAILVATMAIPATAQTPTRSPVSGGSLTVPVTGTANGAPTAGTFTIKRFVALGDQIGAEGTLTLATATGPLVTAATMPVTATTTSAAGAAGPTIQQVGECEVLDLVLGPLDLNLAGLEVHLDVVHLLITADPTGGLLGSLLAGLLCGASGGTLGGLLGNLATTLQQVVNILNQILAILG